MKKRINETPCSKIRHLIAALPYFLLKSPPLNRVTNPKIRETAVATRAKIKSIDKAKFTDYKYLYPDQFSEISSILEKGYVAFNFDRRMRKLVLGIENET